MKKKFWIIPGAALLLAAVLFLCFRQQSPAGTDEAALPSLERDRTSMQGQEAPGSKEESGSSSLPGNDDPARTEGAAQTDPDLTGGELPVDWNRPSFEPDQSAGPGSGSETPQAPPSGEQGETSHAGQDPANTEAEEAPATSEENSGHIVIPILPPDIFP